MAGSNDKPSGEDERKGDVLKKSDLLGSGWETRLEEARARRAAALATKTQPGTTEASKPWEAKGGPVLPPLFDEATGEATEPADLSLLGLEPEEDPVLPQPKPKPEITPEPVFVPTQKAEAKPDEDAVPDGFAEAVAAIRHSRLETDQRLDFNATRDADDPNAPPDENDRVIPLVAAATAVSAAPTATAGTALATVPAVAKASIVASEPQIRWSVVAAATILIAAPILGYSFLMTDNGPAETASISPVLDGAAEGEETTPAGSETQAVTEETGVDRAVEPGLTEPDVVAADVADRAASETDQTLSTGEAAEIALASKPGNDATDALQTETEGRPDDLSLAQSGEAEQGDPVVDGTGEATAALDNALTGDPALAAVPDALGADTDADATASVTTDPVASVEIDPKALADAPVDAAELSKAPEIFAALSDSVTLGSLSDDVAGFKIPTLSESPVTQVRLTRASVALTDQSQAAAALAAKGPSLTDTVPALPQQLGRGPLAFSDTWPFAGVVKLAFATPSLEFDVTLPGTTTQEWALADLNQVSLTIPENELGLAAQPFPGLLHPLGPALEPRRPAVAEPSEQSLVLASLTPPPSPVPRPRDFDVIVPVLLGPTVLLDPPAPAPVLAPTPAEGAPVIYVHASEVADEADVTSVIATLGDGTGFPVETTEPFDFKISQTQVRYFHRDDREAAEAVAATLSARLRSFTNIDPQPQEGTIEVWLSGGGQSGGGTARPAPVAARPAPAPQPAAAPAAPRRTTRAPAPKIESSTIIRRRPSTLGKLLGGSSAPGG